MGFLDIFKKSEKELITKDLTPTFAQVEEDETQGLINLSEALLLDTKTNLQQENTLAIDLGQMQELGNAVSQAAPMLKQAMEKMKHKKGGELYRIANANPGDLLIY